MFVMRKVLCALEWSSGVLQRQILCYGHAAGETTAEQTLVIIIATIKVKRLIYLPNPNHFINMLTISTFIESIKQLLQARLRPTY